MWNPTTPTRDRTRDPSLGVQTLSHWTTREVPGALFLLRGLPGSWLCCRCVLVQVIIFDYVLTIIYEKLEKSLQIYENALPERIFFSCKEHEGAGKNQGHLNLIMGFENFLGYPDDLKRAWSPYKGSFSSVILYSWVQSFWIPRQCTGELLNGSTFVFLPMWGYQKGYTSPLAATSEVVNAYRAKAVTNAKSSPKCQSCFFGFPSESWLGNASLIYLSGTFKHKVFSFFQFLKLVSVKRLFNFTQSAIIGGRFITGLFFFFFLSKVLHPLN